MQDLRIAIAGAGPAGLAAALLLHRDGHRVTVFERFDVPRPLGSGLILQPTGLAVLDALGLASRIHARGQRIDRLYGRAVPSQRIVLDVQYRHLDRALFGLAVHRAALFEPLFQAAEQADIGIETGRTIAGVDGAEGARLSIMFADGSRAGPFDIVIDAMGTRSPLLSVLGGGAAGELAYGALWATLPWPGGNFDPHALEQRYRRASVMVGVLPIGRRVEAARDEVAFFWSIKPAQYETWRAAGLDPWKREVRALWPETGPLLDVLTDAGQLTLARYAHRTLANPVRGRLVAIGDAAHSASPQLGQGANMALLDAAALANALRAEADVGRALARYAALRRSHVRLYQAMSALFTPFYQSDSALLPLLRDWIVAPLTRLPVARMIVAGTVAGTILDPRPRLGQVHDTAAHAPADAAMRHGGD
jgi:2-polyprenyl-6-methoxyphenol hydroxylase-like FAD-dependent oxidoreductase